MIRMVREDIRRSRVLIGLLGLLGACGSDDPPAAPSSDTGIGGSGDASGGSTSPGSDDATAGEGSAGNDESGGFGGCSVDGSCTNQIDLLFVIDNSGTMGVEQENLARNFPLLIRQLEDLEDANGQRVNPDVQIMVTTTDFDSPSSLCALGKPEDYVAAAGAPVATTCLEREDRFTSRIVGQTPQFEACENVCTNVDAKPDGDPFIRLTSFSDNIPDSVTPLDIDGDGLEDSAVSQALSCVGPQGIDGCGYESPLETMLQAINPDAEWNTGARPFLRPNALLAIAIITDEADCSIRPSMASEFVSAEYQEVDPRTGMKGPSSAMCWNAGVSCEPAGDGMYTSCSSVETDVMHGTSRYTAYLIDYLRDQEHKDIIMLGILGVPPVTEHSAVPPYEPTAGGVFDLVYRDWVDGTYPDGDILPEDVDAGATAATKTFEFGIGPGCTGGDAESGFTGQAIPPVRVKEVCEALNVTHESGKTDIRCCIESICDTDYSDALRCLTGIIQQTIVVG